MQNPNLYPLTQMGPLIPPPPYLANYEGINWDNSVLGYFIDRIPVSRAQISLLISTRWETRGNILIHRVGPYMVFECASTQDADDLGEINTINIQGRLMTLYRCNQWTIPANIRFNMAHIWIRLEGLPLALLNDEIAHVILEAVGNVTEVFPQPPLFDLATTIRARVWVDLSLPLIPGCYVPIQGNLVTWVAFRYEKVMRFCKKNGKVGHTTTQCRLPLDMATQGIQRRLQYYDDAGFDIHQGPDDSAFYTNRIRGLTPTPFHWTTRVYLNVNVAVPPPPMPASDYQFDPSDEDNSNDEARSFDHEKLTGVELPCNPFPVRKVVYNQAAFNAFLHNPSLIVQPDHNHVNVHYYFQPPVPPPVPPPGPPPNPPPAPLTPQGDTSSYGSHQASSLESGTTGKWIMSLNNFLDEDEDISMDPDTNPQSGSDKGKEQKMDEFTGSNFTLSPDHSSSHFPTFLPVPHPHEAGPSNWRQAGLSVGHTDCSSPNSSSDFNNDVHYDPNITRNAGIRIGKRKVSSSDSDLSATKKLRKCVIQSDNAESLKTISFNKLKRKLGEGFMAAFYGNSITENGSMNSHCQPPDHDSSGKQWLIIDSECLSSKKRTKLNQQMEAMNSSDKDTSTKSSSDPSSASDSTIEGEVAS